MTITFRNKKNTTRSDKKITPMRTKIDEYLKKNSDMFLGNSNLQLSQIRRIESELLANYSIDAIDDDVLHNYFRLKLYFPRTPYIKSKINEAIAITKKLDDDKDEYVEAERIFRTAKGLADFTDSNMYAWFKRLNSEFKTVGVYHVNIVVMIIYLAMVKKIKDQKMLSN